MLVVKLPDATLHLYPGLGLAARSQQQSQQQLAELEVILNDVQIQQMPISRF